MWGSLHGSGALCFAGYLGIAAVLVYKSFAAIPA